MSSPHCHPKPWSRIFTYNPNSLHKRLAEKYNVLPYMVYRYELMLGDINEVKDLLSLGPGDIIRAIRVNTLRTTTRALRERLEEKGFVVEEYWIPYALVIREEPISVGATHEYMKGYYYIQGAGSQTPVYVTDPKPMERAVDLAAAPGGKTTQIAQHQRDSTPIIAIDISKRRLAALKNHLNRMGVKSVVALHMDARLAPSVLGEETFDYVLLDAPCTGEGLLPLDPRRRTSRRPQDLMDRACLQIQLLDAAVRLAKPGGRIVYTTCSIAPEENEYVVNMILQKYADTISVVSPEILPPGYSPGLTEYNGVVFENQLRNCIRLYPHRTRTEGFTICVLAKNASLE